MLKTSIKLIVHFWKAFTFSLQGLRAAGRYQLAFRAELLFCLIGIPLSFYVGKTAIERLLLISSLLLLLIVELINSAIETIIDRISLERHALSGRAKDLGSAAVLITLLLVLLIWLVIFFLHYPTL
jgi:diacylglycerol kinase (ATP)